MDLPSDLPVEKRQAVRILVLDRTDRVLLLHIQEPLHPEEGACWELPGGGIAPEESVIDAALRELREETGIFIQAKEVGPPNWRRGVTFRHAGVRRVQDEVVVLVRLGVDGPAVDEAHQSADEIATYMGYRWWPVAEVERSAERFFPGQLPALLRRFLDGEHIEEPFEWFS
jgi:8-oxo-dGTP pyrophosphatase MutT (NUDIX family)